MGRRPARNDTGFVLVAVLAMLVILSMLAATVATVATRLRDDQLERQRQLQAELDMASTRANVLYLLATRRMNLGGLATDDPAAADGLAPPTPGPDDDDGSEALPDGSEISLDGRAYTGIGGSRFALQDDRGLLSVNWTSQDWLRRLLSDNGGREVTMERLANLLLDYQDPDDLYRLDSAESEAYLEAGRLPPPNRTLATPLELRRVVGWDEALAFLDDGALVGSVTTTRSALLNVNSAPVRVLRSLPGVDEAAAARIADARRLQPFVNVYDFFELLGSIPANPESLTLYPSASGTLKLWSPDGGPMQVVHWTLTPMDDSGRPWREDYEFTLARDDQAQGDPLVERPPGTPPAALFAEPASPPE